MQRKVKRLGAILLAGLAWGLAVVSYQYAHRPKPAPDHVQESGREIILGEIDRIAVSPFGQTERGRLIVREIHRLLDEDRIVFGPMTHTRGLTWDPLLGRKIIYVKVLEMNGGRWLHQLNWQVMDVVAHESIHSIKSTFKLFSVSIEEECDGFAAGVMTAAICGGNEPPEILKVEGVAVAEFVKRSYPRAKHDDGYEPVGEPLEWLKKKTGL